MKQGANFDFPTIKTSLLALVGEISRVYVKSTCKLCFQFEHPASENGVASPTNTPACSCSSPVSTYSPSQASTASAAVLPPAASLTSASLFCSCSVSA